MKLPGRVAVLLALACAAPRAFASGVDVRLRQEASRTYEIEGAFTVKAPSSVVWDVLTDYERIPDFVKSMRASRVLDGRRDGPALVEQEAVGGIFFVSRSVRVLLQVTRAPGRLDFRDVDGGDFRTYSGSWRTSPVPNGTRVSYRLVAAPRFFAPSFLLKPGMRDAARGLLSQVRAEIVRRAGEPAFASR
ncbi:MAG: SRPBCC family protein [Elusimicrobia bacterium]|nr:SRPBCC family protein [Elusimicrobiota bacterium]